MKDRLNKILAYEKLTPSKFADIIGVQRSSVSHILSGRNNPSLDFMRKVLDQFTNISGDWLITGKGDMLKTSKAKKYNFDVSKKSTDTPSASPGNTLFDTLNNSKESAPAPPEQKVESIVEENIQPKIAAINALNVGGVTTRKIDKIVLFYNDNTFEEFSPS